MVNKREQKQTASDESKHRRMVASYVKSRVSDAKTYLILGRLLDQDSALPMQPDDCKPDAVATNNAVQMLIRRLDT